MNDQNVTAAQLYLMKSCTQKAEPRRQNSHRKCAHLVGRTDNLPADVKVDIAGIDLQRMDDNDPGSAENQEATQFSPANY